MLCYDVTNNWNTLRWFCSLGFYPTTNSQYWHLKPWLAWQVFENCNINISCVLFWFHLWCFVCCFCFYHYKCWRLMHWLIIVIKGDQCNLEMPVCIESVWNWLRLADFTEIKLWNSLSSYHSCFPIMHIFLSKHAYNRGESHFLIKWVLV